METTWLDVPKHFVGRDGFVARFRARYEHFRFFLYAGISGIGKTSLMRRLADEARQLDLNGSVYLAIYPGETVHSLLARLECRLLGGRRFELGHAGDPYARLVDLLSTRRLLLILDALHNLRREDFLALVRLFHRAKGTYRVLGAYRGDPELAAIDKQGVHLERLGALNVHEISLLATSMGITGPIMEQIEADAHRGGALAHPLICRTTLALGVQALPDATFLASQSARSVHAFRAFLGHLAPMLHPDLVRHLHCLIRIGTAIPRELAAELIGEQDLATLLHCGLLDEIRGDIYVHILAVHYFGEGEPLQGEMVHRIADYLRVRAQQVGEPVAAIRAAEILAAAGQIEMAVESLATTWRWARDPSFLDAYLRALAKIPTSELLAPRLKLLNAQVKVRQGNAQTQVPQLQELGSALDPWTRRRAWLALVHAQSELNQHEQVIVAFNQFKSLEPPSDELLSVGTLAVQSLMALQRLLEAEELIVLLQQDPQSPSHPGLVAQLQHHLARIYAQTGRIPAAVVAAEKAAAQFEEVGDHYNRAMAFYTVAELHREGGEFQLARDACQQFAQAAEIWGDRSLTQLATLASCFVALDIGDVAYAAKQIGQVVADLGPAPSPVLRRTLAAAQALLEAGRGHHERAASMLMKVVAAWDAAGMRTVVGGLRAQMIRSLIACDKLDLATEAVNKGLTGLDPDSNGGRIAALLRESALIRLRKGQPKVALEELTQACQLFAKGGNRREEAMTLHRLAHAALDEGYLELAEQKVAEAMALAKEIDHSRALALSFELQSRLLLAREKYKEAIAHGREALSRLRKLGDETGVLHLSETLIRIYLVLGDLSRVLRLTKRLRDQAKIAGLTDLRIRSIAWMGIALLRQERLKLAARCYRPLPERGFGPWTRGLLARFGESLALAEGNRKEALKRRKAWVSALGAMSVGRCAQYIHALSQFSLAPRDRCYFRIDNNTYTLGTEAVALLHVKDFDLLIDCLSKRIYDAGEIIEGLQHNHQRLLFHMGLAWPKALPALDALKILEKRITKDATSDSKMAALAKDLNRVSRQTPHLILQGSSKGMRFVPPRRLAVLIPFWQLPHLNETQRHILRALRRLGAASMQAVIQETKLSKALARREIQALVQQHYIQTLREGRGQVYRLG